MNTPKKILVDADAFVALHLVDDPSHEHALILSNRISNEGIELLVSDPALGEAITVLSQETSISLAVEFAVHTLKGPIGILEVDSSLRAEALSMFSKQTSKNSRFTDCVNMVIMKRERIDTIFSFDKHYKKNGFRRFGIDEPKKA